MISLYKKLNFEQKVVLLLVVLFMAFIPLIALSPYFQGSPSTYRSRAYELVTPVVNQFISPTPEIQATSVTDNLNISADKRTIGKVQSITSSAITLVDLEGVVKTFLLDENTRYMRYIILSVTPDPEGFVPEQEESLTSSNINVNDQIEVSWQEQGGDLKAILIELL